MLTSGANVPAHQIMSMPLIRQWLAATSVALWAQSLPAQDGQPYQNVYRGWLEAGPLFSDNTELHSFPGTAGSSKLSLDTGFRVGLGADYTLSPYLSFGWEIGVLGSSVDKASGLEEMDALITQVPFLVSLALRYENETGFTPFISLGVGGATTAISVDEARSSTTIAEGSDYDFVFAWQAAGGLKYQFRSGLELGVLYKYLWTSDAEWELDDDVAGTGNPKLEMDGICSHAVLAFVSYRF
jgi:opacity protein-like surface antigen